MATRDYDSLTDCANGGEKRSRPLEVAALIYRSIASATRVVFSAVHFRRQESYNAYQRG